MKTVETLENLDHRLYGFLNATRLTGEERRTVTDIVEDAKKEIERLFNELYKV